MSPRARQLLLEILLLKEKYSSRDVNWVRKALTHDAQAMDILRLLSTPEAPEKLFSKTLGRFEHPEEQNITKKAIQVIASLRKDKSNRGFRRAENLAKRLDLKIRGQSHEELITEIAESIGRLPDNQARSILERYKVTEPDQSYIELANTIMKNQTRD